MVGNSSQPGEFEEALRDAVARLERARDRERRLGEITRAISASLDLDQVLEMIRRAVVETLGFDRCGIFLVEPEQGIIRGVCGTDRHGEWEDLHNTSFSLEEDPDGPMQRVVRRDIDYFLTDDWDRGERFPPGHTSHGVRAHALVPLMAGDLVVGILAVDNLMTSRTIGEPAVKELFGFADAAAVAIQNARLYTAATRRSEDLAAEVATQTTRLQEARERMLQAERMAAIGIFAGRLAHDLRNPLNVLQLNLQLLRRRLGEDPQVLRPFERVEQAMQQASAMVTDLLDFARLGEPRLAQFRLEPLLRRQSQEQTPPEGVQFQLEVEPDLPPLEADLEQLQQALRHLVSNALQAMRDQQGSITLAARRVDGAIAVSVSDEGCGIPPERIERLFDPLFTTRPRGTGLGLAVCRKIVENHGGEIKVESVPDRGTTFTLLLPISRQPSDEGGQEKPKSDDW
jgi:signal transduction histidine kinase